MSNCNVIWDTPSTSSSGSMPLGNGETGLNLWVEEGGDLLLLLARTDAWDENMRLLKLGRVRVGISPNPFASGQPFRQALNLREGCIAITAGPASREVRLRVWVDAHRSVVHVECDADEPVECRVTRESWRNQTRPLMGEETTFSDPLSAGSADGTTSEQTPVVSADVMVEGRAGQVTWYHHNEGTGGGKYSAWETSLRLQSLEGFAEKQADPLLNRIFGGSVVGRGMVNRSSSMLLSDRPRRSHRVEVHTLTQHPSSPGRWLAALDDAIAQAGRIDRERAWGEHGRWWGDFWDRSWLHISGTDDAANVSRAYVLQRFISACAGRGNFPIKYNGSLFTVDGRTEKGSSDPFLKVLAATTASVDGRTAKGSYDADYRRWGGAYWFQNTRLAYWPMLAAGDFDLMRPLFKMYLDALPLALRRTATYYGHDGAFFPETMYFWGTYSNGDYGWDRRCLPAGYLTNRFVRFYWSGGLELCAMMLDYYEGTQDTEFLRSTLQPLVSEIVRFFGQHWPRDASGKIRFEPAAALETWQEATNPTPEVAGLRFVLDRLLALSKDLFAPALQEEWCRLRQELPDLPLGTAGDKRVILPAERFSRKSNYENPELYAVFPYRLFGVGKPSLDVARDTYNTRLFRLNNGWCQDSIQAAHLGLAIEAQSLVTARAKAKNEQSRFPAFWGPNFDWTPDQDHGVNLLTTLQSMLLQTDGKKVLLFPAWPKEWDVEFKLHAPYQTIIEGAFRGGRLTHLKVTPPERTEDVVRCEPQ